jgi:hypothetical protein
LRRIGINATGILTGDIFDKASFEDFAGLKPTENKILITVNGILTDRADAVALRDSVKSFNVGGRRVAAQNGTHGIGLGDAAEILLNEVGIADLSALRLAWQIEIAAQALKKSGAKDPTIYVVAHSQGTMVFYRALALLRKETWGMIEFYGNGGEVFVPSDIGLKRAVNFYRVNDPVPVNANNPLLPTRWIAYAHQYNEVWNIGMGPGRGIAPHLWANNYDQQYKDPSGVRIPPDSKRVKYPGPLR